MQLPKFLIVQFPSRATGNFFASILQCSPEVVYWNIYQQIQKSINDWIPYFNKFTMCYYELCEYLEITPVPTSKDVHQLQNY